MNSGDFKASGGGPGAGAGKRSRGEARARLFARCALLAAAAAVVGLFLPYAAGGLLILGGGVLGLALCAAGVWWLVAHRGPVRFLGALVALGAPAAVLVLFVHGGLWTHALRALLLWAVALAFARTAMRHPDHKRHGRSRPRPAPRALRPVLLMNPRSGDGKVGRFGLVEKAERLGARVVLLEPGPDGARPDPAALARAAVADGADLLGVAGGDGTQALVAAVAAEHDLPFVVISAGTRNHFAMDLGLDRADPVRCLDALTDGEELRVDLGEVAGRAFVNTVSFGVYADVVQRPEYREAKAETALNTMPDLLAGGAGRRLDARVDDAPLPAQQALLVSNNPYASPDPLGGGRRIRLDGGELGVIGIRVEGAAQAADLAVRGPQSPGLSVLTAHRVEVTAGSDGGADPGADGSGSESDGPGQGSGGADFGSTGSGSGPGVESDGSDSDSGDPGTLPVAVDGEAMRLPTPVVCTLRPRALRVRLPRERPGTVPPTPPPDWRLIAVLAFRRRPRGGSDD
ncbi:diacylglycerol kinase family protein [Streptomyces sp. NPDC048717]|uniref:diacylglycerol/lipid kinase family protein n=1 Tax=Streptomyces sp. NPDC048717 TaxID=3154928 RepID=UPI0034262C87